MRTQAGLPQVLIMGLLLLIGTVVFAGGAGAQADRRPASEAMSASNWNGSARGTESPLQLDHMVYLPIVMMSCLPDPPGESSNIDDALTVCSEQSVSGQVGDDDWDDVYKIRAAANQQLTISMSGSGGDADLYLYPPDATDINTDDFADSSTNIGNDELIEATLLEDGFWYINVNSFEGTTDYNMTVALSNP